jgi:hypothetical protein
MYINSPFVTSSTANSTCTFILRRKCGIPEHNSYIFPTNFKKLDLKNIFKILYLNIFLKIHYITAGLILKLRAPNFYPWKETGLSEKFSYYVRWNSVDKVGEVGTAGNVQVQWQNNNKIQ